MPSFQNLYQFARRPGKRFLTKISEHSQPRDRAGRQLTLVSHGIATVVHHQRVRPNRRGRVRVELERIERTLKKIDKDLSSLDKRLGDAKFTSNAPPQVVDEAREQKAQLERQRTRLTEERSIVDELKKDSDKKSPT